LVRIENMAELRIYFMPSNEEWKMNDDMLLLSSQWIMTGIVILCLGIYYAE
jgi:hypothetical protein